MKTILTTIVIFLSCISITACDTMNNQDVGTLAGGIAGGILGSTIGKGGGQLVAIGAGSLIGAYLGGSVGRSMDRADRMHMVGALENNQVGKPAYWRNMNTGVEYEVVPTRNVRVKHHRYCREYRTMAIIDGRKQSMYGTACRQPDGSWKAVR